MTVVADTSSLIVLVKVRRLDLLRALYDEIVLPTAVAEELPVKPDAIGADLREVVTGPGLRPRSMARFSSWTTPTRRRVARELGLRVTGVLGVLVEAKARGLVPAVRPILDALGDEGFWLSEPLRTTILDAVRE